MVTWKDECPQCGRLKDKRSELCQQCRRAVHISPRRQRRENEKDTCPQCGQTKHKRSKLCVDCWRQNVIKDPDRLVPCPQCGGLKDVRSKLCHKCHFDTYKPGDKRLCGGCNKLLDEDNFGYSNVKANRRRSRCRECEAKASDEWRKKNQVKYKQTKKRWNKENPDRLLKMSIRRRLRKIGVNEENIPNLVEYVLATTQCNICGCTLDKAGAGHKYTFAIDHIHGTNQVRGLLCTRCNQAIGQFRDDPDALLQAAKYVKNPGWHIQDFLCE